MTNVKTIKYYEILWRRPGTFDHQYSYFFFFLWTVTSSIWLGILLITQIEPGLTFSEENLVLNWCKTLELITSSFPALLVTCRLCRFIKCCTAWFLFRSPIMNKIIDYKTVFHLMENTYLNAELPRKKGFLVVTCQDTTTFRIILHWIVTSVSHAL